MRLICTKTVQLLEDTYFEEVQQKMPYVILSHRWGKNEVTFQDMAGPGKAKMKKGGYDKIRKTCEIAKGMGYAYAWVDTCCIDKTSSSELSETINSMFRWYQNSAVCLAYLDDIDARMEWAESGGGLYPFMSRSKWFRRGWTLQELIAPSIVDFYDKDWRKFGTKSHPEFLDVLIRITKIPAGVLGNPDKVTSCTVAQRMSWASDRETTRVEDMAYSLIGIFGISMPMLYGEGARAFIRLQEEIAKGTNDMTLFCWTLKDDPSVCEHGIFALSPSYFRGAHNLVSLPWAIPREFSLVNGGIRITTQLRKPTNWPGISYVGEHFLLSLDCGYVEDGIVGMSQDIALRKTPSGYVRLYPGSTYAYHPRDASRYIHLATEAIFIRKVISRSEFENTKLAHSVAFQGARDDVRVYSDPRSVSAFPRHLWDESRNIFLATRFPRFGVTQLFVGPRELDRPTYSFEFNILVAYLLPAPGEKMRYWLKAESDSSYSSVVECYSRGQNDPTRTMHDVLRILGVSDHFMEYVWSREDLAGWQLRIGNWEVRDKPVKKRMKQELETLERVSTEPSSLIIPGGSIWLTVRDDGDAHTFLFDFQANIPAVQNQ
ncbi:Heterokaryon incompatibility protein (HET) domain containing protein [Rhypophila sp. PSN 637]